MKKSVILILFLWLAGIVAGMQFAKFSATIGLIQGEIGINALYSGWLLSSLGVIGIVFGVTSGVVVSRFSPVKLVSIFLFWAAACSVLQTMVASPEAILGIRLLEGVSQLILVSAAPTALLQATPKQHQSLVMTLWGTFFGGAFLLMNLVQEPLLAFGGWRAVFWGHGAFAFLVGCVLLLFWRTGTKETQTGNNEISFLKQHLFAYKEKASLLPGLLFGCHTAMYLVFLTYLPQWFQEQYPESLGGVSFLLVSMPLFSLLGTFLSGVLLSKAVKSPLRLIQSGFSLMIGLCLCLVFQKSQGLFLVLVSLMLTCSGVLQGAVFATIPYFSDDSTIHAYANGTISQMGNIGTTIGAPVFSSLLLFFGWQGAMALPVVSSLVGIGFALMIGRKMGKGR